jgi:hypothetical protein
MGKNFVAAAESAVECLAIFFVYGDLMCLAEKAGAGTSGLRRNGGGMRVVRGPPLSASFSGASLPFKSSTWAKLCLKVNHK